MVTLTCSDVNVWLSSHTLIFEVVDVCHAFLHMKIFKEFDKAYAFTFAVVGDTPNPVLLLTAKALATHDVIVSGIVVLTVTRPSGLKEI